MKRKLKIFIFSSLIFGLVCSKILEATPLVNKSMSITELNGTNGITIINSKDPVLWGWDLTFVDKLLPDWVALRGGGSPVIFELSETDKAFFDALSVNGTNGFTTHELYARLDGHPPAAWNTKPLIIGGSMIENFDQYPIHIIGFTNNIMDRTVSLTNSSLAISSRSYVTNIAQSKIKKIMAGNFLGYYSIAANLSSLGLNVLSLQNLTNYINIFGRFSFNNVLFQGADGDLARVGDTNGDGYDDLLIASGCWLVFGGRNWSGEVALTSIGTNGVQLSSLCPNHPVSSAGDMNDDGIDDILYCDGEEISEYNYIYHVALVYGQTNWPTSFESKNLNGYNGTKFGGLDGYAVEVAGNGDINGDGHEDVVIIHYDGYLKTELYVLYGGPFLKPSIPLWNPPVLTYFSGTNGFKITGTNFEPDWANADINGDANGDGFDDILFAIGASSRPTNYAWLVYGGQSPSAPPALRTPLWINVGESNSLTFELTDVPTNIVWTGCKKGDDYTFCYTNGVRCSAWDIPMGKLWFTNSYTITSTDEFLTVSYTSTNALGPAAGFTTLTIEPIPEPITTGIVFLTTALIGKALATNKTNKSLNY